MSENSSLFYEFGPFRLDEQERRLLRDGEEVTFKENGRLERLTPKAFDLLLLLVKQSGQMIGRDDLLERIWPGTFVEDNRLSDNISTLRRFLSDPTRNPQFIETVPKYGYRFVAEVREVRDESVALVEHTRTHIVIEEETGADTITTATDLEAEELPAAFPEHEVALDTASPRATPGSGWLKKHRAAWALVLLGVIPAILLAALFLSGGIAGLRRWATSPDSNAAREMVITRVTNSGKVALSTISPDGQLIAYAQNYTSGTGSIYVRQRGSNTEIQLLEPGKRIFGGTCFAADGGHIYYVVYDDRDPRGALYRIPALGGRPSRLLQHVETMFSLSPDEQQVTFHRHDPSRKQQSLVVAALDGGSERTLLTRPYTEVAFTAWAPDGKTIAFNRANTPQPGDKEPATIYGIDVESGATRSLTPERWTEIGKMVWTSDGRGLVFVARRPQIGNQLYYLAFPEGKVRRITNGVHGFGNYGLGITADGSTLVADSWESSAQLWMVGAGGDATSAVRLTTGGYDGVRGIASLPGGQIVYAALGGSEVDFWTVKEDGAGAKPLTADSFRDEQVAASHDGGQLVFASDRAGGSHIFRANADGSNVQQLTFGEAFDSAPDFSPDAGSIVYTSLSSERTTVWKVSADGGTPLRLTDYECVGPSFSPDGKFIACIVPSDSIPRKGSFVIIPAEGGPPVRQFNVAPFEWIYPSTRWTPDGQALVFRDEANQVYNLWQQPLSGETPSQLTNFKTEIIFNYTYSQDGQHVILSRGDRLVDVVLIKDFMP